MGTFKQEKEYLIHVISSLLQNVSLPIPPRELDWNVLYRISARHRLSNMLCYGIEKLPFDFQPTPKVMEEFQRDRKLALAREAAQHFCLDEILKALEERQIHCLPLKGYLVKDLYPQPDMRLMADIDILCRDEQTEKVKNLLPSLGFTLKNFGGIHDVYTKKPFINLEMHRRLISQDSPYSEYLTKTWQRAHLDNGYKYIYRLSPEDFYIYLFIHLTKHYTKGGTGVRSILDVWLYEKHYGAQLDREYVKKELEQVKLREFAENIRGLAAVWFGGAKSNRLYEEMAEYIFASGVYGIERHEIIASINNNQGEQIGSMGMTKFRYRLKLFFPGLRHMGVLYPFLHRLPWLIPLIWVHRGLKCVLLKNRRTFRIIRNVYAVTEKDLDKIRNLYKRSGLDVR